MTFDAHANLASGLVSVAPSPATSGTSMTVTLDATVALPATPFNATVAPVSATPTHATAEIVRVTNVAGSVWTVTRAQEGTSARTVIVGDQVFVGATAKSLTDIESAVTAETARASAALVPVALKAANYAPSVNEFVPVDATSGVITITLPTAPADKTRIGVKKIDSSVNLVTLARGGSDVFNQAGGSTSVSLTYQNQGVQLQYESATGIWYAVAADLGLTALDTRYLGTNTAQSRLPGIWVPYGWGSRSWRAKLAALVASPSSALGIVSVFGDSLHAHEASNPLTKSWTSLMRIALQALGGDGGSGYRSAYFSDVGITATAGATCAAAWAGKIASTTGTWSHQNNGQGQYSMTSAVNGSTITYAFSGTAVDFSSIEGTPAATWSYSIDGGASVPITPGASNVEVMRSVTGLAAGAHTIVMTFTGASGTFFSNGVRGRNAGGIRVDDYSRFGAASGSGFESYGLGWNGGSKESAAPDLLIYALAANDGNAAVTGDVWEQNVRKYLTDALDGTGRSAATDLIIWLPHIGKNDTSNILFQDYAARARGLAEAYGAALVDFWTIGRTSYNYWTSLGYWGNTNYSGNAGTDNIHLSDAGHQFVWNTLAPLITATA